MEEVAGTVFGLAPSVWFPVVTLVVGIVLKGVFDALADSRIARRERAARRDHRLDALHFKRIEFQRSTLLELQEAVEKLARYTGKAHHLDRVEYEKSKTWGNKLLPEDLSDGLLWTQNETNRLRVRINDDEVRRLGKEFVELCVKCSMAKNKSDAEQAMLNMSSKLTELYERIGCVIRTLDVNESQIK